MKSIKYILIKFIKLYKNYISPYLGNNCRYLPTCYDFVIDSLEEEQERMKSRKNRIYEYYEEICKKER